MLPVMPSKVEIKSHNFLRKGLHDRSWFAALMKWLTTHHADSALRNTATAHLDLHVIILSTNYVACHALSISSFNSNTDTWRRYVPKSSREYAIKIWIFARRSLFCKKALPGFTWFQVSSSFKASATHNRFSPDPDPNLIFSIRFTKPLYWWEKGGRDCGRPRRFGDSDTKYQLRINNRSCVAEA